ncbi:ACP S-malonyltransferase [Streptomyces sp. NPDC056149]|uniref:ACP S-malonyltransferase n=1 Tax=Streptomyces sp. NPDC056149 TaxID=3345728 RepID=UPI0035D63B23
MKAICALFPGLGLGEQHPGMGRCLVESFPAAQDVFDEASTALDTDMRRLCWQSTPRTLAQAPNAQPALVTTALAAWRVLESLGVPAALAAGHGLGTLTALAATGAMSLSDAVQLARQHGEITAATPGEGRMCTAAASNTLPRHRLTALARRLGLHLAADNGPHHLTFAGSRRNVQRYLTAVGPRAHALGAPHACHSPLMRSAEPQWRDIVAATDIRRPRAPVALPSRGTFTTDPQALRADLIATLHTPVPWRTTMVMAGSRPRVALGPARQLIYHAAGPHQPPIPLVASPATAITTAHALAQH